MEEKKRRLERERKRERERRSKKREKIGCWELCLRPTIQSV